MRQRGHLTRATMALLFAILPLSIPVPAFADTLPEAWALAYENQSDIAFRACRPACHR